MQPPLDSLQISTLFECIGREVRATPDMSQTDHALHCATRAENAGESADLIVAALLHDIGHMLAAEARLYATSTVDLPAESPVAGALDFGGREIVVAKRAARKLTLAALQGWLPDDAVAAVRLLHPAKRYLCAVEDGYWDDLTAANQAELLADGGPYDAALIARFRQYPCHAAAVRLRRYDDLAKQPSITARPLSHFMHYLQQYAPCDADTTRSLANDTILARPASGAVAPQAGFAHPSTSFHLPTFIRRRSGANA